MQMRKWRGVICMCSSVGLSVCVSVYLSIAMKLTNGKTDFDFIFIWKMNYLGVFIPTYIWWKSVKDAHRRKMMGYITFSQPLTK